jgi:hypothetical protein
MRKGHAVTCLLGSAQFGLGLNEFPIALDDEFRGTHGLIVEVLQDLANAPSLGHGPFALVFVQTPREQGKETGFARPVATHQAYFFTRMQGKGGVIKDDA